MGYENMDIVRIARIAVRYIVDSIRERRPVLVHCMAGISRSAAIVIAYLMATEQLDFDAALAKLREKRPIVNPNQGFCAQLRAFTLEATADEDTSDMPRHD